MNQDKIIDIEDLTPDAHNFNQGTDEAENTDYCQYCCYTEGEGKGYILAMYQAEETK